MTNDVRLSSIASVFPTYRFTTGPISVRYKWIFKSLTVFRYARNIQPLEPYILRNINYLSIYVALSLVTLEKLDVTTESLFFNTSRVFLRCIPNYTVESLFRNFINTHFPDFTIVFTNGFASETSASYSFYIQKIELSSYGTLTNSLSIFSADAEL